MKRGLLIASAVLVSVTCGPPAFQGALAQTAVSATIPSYSAASEIASAVYGASATQEAAPRSADARIRSLMISGSAC